MEESLQKQNIQLSIVREFEDGATMKAFGQEGHGLFPGSSVISREIIRQYQIRSVGHIASLTERFYGITVDHRIKQPTVLAISTSSKDSVFA